MFQHSHSKVLQGHNGIADCNDESKACLMPLSAVEALKGSLGDEVRELAKAHDTTVRRTEALEEDLEKARSELVKEISVVCCITVID